MNFSKCLRTPLLTEHLLTVSAFNIDFSLILAHRQSAEERIVGEKFNVNIFNFKHNPPSTLRELTIVFVFHIFISSYCIVFFQH